MAAALQIRLVVEETMITSVRHDVVNVGRHHNLSLPKTFLTIKVLSDETVAQLFPAVRVPAVIGAPGALDAALLSRLLGAGLGVLITLFFSR